MEQSSVCAVRKVTIRCVVKQISLLTYPFSSSRRKTMQLEPRKNLFRDKFVAIIYWCLTHVVQVWLMQVIPIIPRYFLILFNEWGKRIEISLIIIDWETVAKRFINFLEKSNKILIAELGTFWRVSQVTKNMNTNLTIALLMAEDPPSKDSFSVVTSSSFADVIICSKCNSVLSELLSPKKEQLVWFYQIINNSN